MKRDRRLTPARPDLAATYLRGEVEAARFVEGRAMRVAEALVDLRRDPQPDGGVETQALFGERVMVYEDYEVVGPGRSCRVILMSAICRMRRLRLIQARRRIASPRHGRFSIRQPA